jgi:nitrate reductase beta subunit
MIANYEDRFVIPTSHEELRQEDFHTFQGQNGFTFGDKPEALLIKPLNALLSSVLRLGNSLTASVNSCQCATKSLVGYSKSTESTLYIWVILFLHPSV